MYDMFEKAKGCNQLAEEIYIEFINDRELISMKDLYAKINLLIDNKMAAKLTGYADRYSSHYISFLDFASYYMIKKDKSLKKYRYNKNEKKIKTKYIDEPVDNNIIKYKKKALENGDYIVKPEDYTYIILSINTNKESEYGDYETVTIYFVGDKYEKYKKEFQDQYEEVKSLNKGVNYETVTYGYENSKPDRFKSFDQMVFRDKDTIINYIDRWVANIPEYYKYGMTPKLSILLYGKPGTGKSTFYKALAKHLGISSIHQITPEQFNDAEPRRGRKYRDDSVIAIDDIDCFCESREDENKSNNSREVLSKILNFLDTPPTIYFKAKDDIYYPVSIVVATTNYIDRLDPAVIRYGRFDFIIEMEYFDEDESREFCKIYDLQLEDVVDKKEITKDFTIVPAKLQALCFENIDKRLKGDHNDK